MGNLPLIHIISKVARRVSSNMRLFLIICNIVALSSGASIKDEEAYTEIVVEDSVPHSDEPAQTVVDSDVPASADDGTTADQRPPPIYHRHVFGLPHHYPGLLPPMIHTPAGGEESGEVQHGVVYPFPPRHLLPTPTPVFPPHGPCFGFCDYEMMSKCQCVQPAVYREDGSGNCNIDATNQTKQVWCYIAKESAMWCPDARPDEKDREKVWSRIACISGKPMN